MAGQSKNSRGGKMSGTQAKSGHTAGKLLIPIGGGAGAYVLNPANGSNRNLRVASDAFSDAIGELVAAGLAQRVREELDALHVAQPTHGWDATLARLQSAGVLD